MVSRRRGFGLCRVIQLTGPLPGEHLEEIMRQAMTFIACALLVSRADAQRVGSKFAASLEQQARELVGPQLNDTSPVHQYVAHDLLRRATRAVRRTAAAQLAAALRDTSRRVQRSALTALEGMGADASPALPAVMEIAGNRRHPLRMSAFHSFSRMRMGVAGRAGIPVLLEAARDSSEGVRLEAAAGLLSVDDTASAVVVYRASLNSAVDYLRLAAATALADHSDSLAVPALQSLLTDSAFFRRVAAARFLGVEGPRAAAAVPALVAMLNDTALRPLARTAAVAAGANAESAAAFGASAIAEIMPFRGAGGSIPLRASIEGRSNALSDDGLGVYSWGVDSVFIVKLDAIAFMLASDNSPRGPLSSLWRPLRRSLSFDLSKPVAGSGAKPMGLIRDNEAQIHIWYDFDPNANRLVSINGLDVSDSVRPLGRVEMHFRINGELHILQMGPFAEGQMQVLDRVWRTGIHGDGTSQAQIAHPSSLVWTLRAPTGSVARLWNLKDRAHAVNRGLYAFSFQIRFMAFPSGDVPCLHPAGDHSHCSP